MEYCRRIFLEGLRKTTTNFNQGVRPDYEAGVLTITITNEKLKQILVNTTVDM
jgi:hypothetical protein